jgi:hypothetical protein
MGFSVGGFRSFAHLRLRGTIGSKAIRPRFSQNGKFQMNESEQERRTKVERFVCHENIVRFRHLLTTDPNERERKMLISLLAGEQEKQIELEDRPKQVVA